MPRRRDPIELATDKILRTIEALSADQRALVLNNVRLVLELTGAMPKTGRKPREKRQPSPTLPLS